MKHLSCSLALVVLIGVCALFTSCESCEDDGQQSINNDAEYVGEWRPVRYATTYNDVVITDEDEDVEAELYNEWDFGWLILSKNSFRSVTDAMQGSYVANDEQVTFCYDGFGGKYVGAYDIISFKNDKLIITDSDGQCEIFTLEKFQERSINTQDIVGRWRASKMVAYYNNGNMGSSTGGFIGEHLNGLEYINITNTDITLVGKNRNCSYYISNNNLYTTPGLSEFAIASAHIRDIKNGKLYIHYVSLDGKKEMYVKYRMIE